MLWSLCYLVFRCVLQLVLLRLRSEDFKELEIVVLRHDELSVVRRQIGRAQLTSSDRVSALIPHEDAGRSRPYTLIAATRGPYALLSPGIPPFPAQPATAMTVCVPEIPFRHQERA